MVRFMFDTLRRGMDNSDCFNLAENWTAEAFEAAHQGLGEGPHLQRTPRSCASEVVRKMGGTDEE